MQLFAGKALLPQGTITQRDTAYSSLFQGIVDIIATAFLWLLGNWSDRGLKWLCVMLQKQGNRIIV